MTAACDAILSRLYALLVELHAEDMADGTNDLHWDTLYDPAPPAATSLDMSAIRLLVFHLEDGFYATQSTCTHVFAPLNRGKLVDGHKLQCPLHRAQFDVRTGEVVRWANFPPGIQVLNVVRGEKALATYPVSGEDGELFVELP